MCREQDAGVSDIICTSNVRVHLSKTDGIVIAYEGLHYCKMGKIFQGWEFGRNPNLYEIVPHNSEFKIKIYKKYIYICLLV